MLHRNQKGFGVLGVAVALVFVGVVGFAGYKVVTMNKVADSQATTARTAQEVAVPETIKTKADLTQTSKALDSSSTQLDNGLSESSLDADVDSML